MATENNKLDEWLTKVTETMLKQCSEGAQSQDLGSDDYRACGQFYGPNVMQRKQVGLHGMASAIAILRNSTLPNADSTAHQIASFCSYLFSSNDQAKVDAEDLKNVIKIAELLTALQDSILDKSLTDKLHGLLMSGRHQSDGSWGYYLDDSESHEVPTSYALIALAPRLPLRELLVTRKFLWARYAELSKQPEISDIGSMGRRVLILFALSAHPNHEDKEAQDKSVASEIKKLWHTLSRAYGTAFEVTEEYYRHDKNHYVRIPWQIYLAHSLVHSSSRYYYSAQVQRFLVLLVSSTNAGGYCYPQSGSLLSSRTNNSIVQFFRVAKRANPKKSPWFAAWDLICEAWTLWFVRYPIVVLLAIGTLRFADSFKAYFTGVNPLHIEVIGNAVNFGLFLLASKYRGKP